MEDDQEVKNCKLNLSFCHEFLQKKLSLQKRIASYNGDVVISAGKKEKKKKSLAKIGFFPFNKQF
jgi:hypothetical protein